MDIKKKIDKLFSLEFLELLKIIGNLAKDREERVFLVGGIVRDLIIDLENKDIDIAVEGNGIEFAKNLKDKLKAKKVIIHEKFGTAVVIVDKNIKLDIATTRTEKYEYSGSLPIIKFGKIEDDMYRRDFTINAMGLEITEDKFGELIDFYSGKNDLYNGEIKVLYRESFIDDPTRIIRAIKFSARYDFKLEEETEILLKEAIKKGLLDNISNDRFKNELKLLFSDKNIKKSMKCLEKYKIFSEISKKIVYTLEVDKKLDDLEEMGKLIEYSNIEKWKLIFLMILENLKNEELEEVLKRFNISNKFISKYKCEIEKNESMLEGLNKATKNSQIYKVLDRISGEMILLIYLKTQEKSIREKIGKYIFVLSKSKPIITGKDLIKLGIKPGVEFKEILDRYFIRQLDLKSPTKNKMLKER